MSLLLIEIPPRERLAARSGGDAPAPPAAPEWFYVLSNDNGRSVTRSGRAATALLPRADRVVAVLSPGDVTWHHLTLPRMGAGKLRLALAGLLEEALLDEPDDVHFALAHKPDPGEATWVAVLHRAWLTQLLADFDAADLPIEQVVPALMPLAPSATTAIGQFREDTRAAGNGDAHRLPVLAVAHAQGVVELRLAGGFTRHWVSSLANASWSAPPGVAAAAERWLGAPVPVQPAAERLLAAARSPCNLRQFDLAPRHRGTRWLREGLRRLLGPQWRALRWGLAGLLALHLIGVNVYAWQQGQRLNERRTAIEQLLRSTHPQVRAVLDAPAQMQRETEVLRAAAGRAGDSDLEVLLAAASSAWPDGMPPVQALRFEPGKLTLAAPGLGAPQLAPIRERLRTAGFAVEAVDGRVSITRMASGGAR